VGHDYLVNKKGLALISNKGASL